MRAPVARHPAFARRRVGGNPQPPHGGSRMRRRRRAPTLSAMHRALALAFALLAPAAPAAARWSRDGGIRRLPA
jgi:hypothetical protein